MDNDALNIEHIRERILSGKVIQTSEAYTLMDEKVPLSDLLSLASALTRKHFESRIGVCCIYPVKIGHCGNDCAFCAQSTHHSCVIDTLLIQDVETNHLVESVKTAEHQGAGWFSLVSSGEELNEREFAIFLRLIERIRAESDISLCASLGKLDSEKAAQIKAAGISRYHHNIETSPKFFPHICSTHTIEDKVRTIQVAKQASLEVCCGGIISMGETAQDRVDMALLIRELNVSSVPVNILSPIAGTRLEHQNVLDPDEILRTLAIFRILLPEQTIRLAGGRERALGSREYEAYDSGVNALIAGNFLTTSGKSLEKELATLRERGLEVDTSL